MAQQVNRTPITKTDERRLERSAAQENLPYSLAHFDLEIGELACHTSREALHRAEIRMGWLL